MSDDFEWLSKTTGEGGGLSKTADFCGSINDGLTKFLDAMFGPNEVDGFDASCNTCAHFQRKPMDAEEKRLRNIYGMPGTCGLDGTKVLALRRGLYDGFDHAQCYVNRRTGKRPHECCLLKD